LSTENIEIVVENQTSRFNVRPEKIENIAALACEAFSFRTCQLNISFVEPETIRQLNRDYRRKDQVTDVLSFPQVDWQKPLLSTEAFSDSPEKFMNELPLPGIPLHLGDIVIAPEKAQENASTIGQSLERELCFLIVHGLLHLLGHDHQEAKEEQRMLQEQKILMNILDGDNEKVSHWRQVLCEAQSQA